MYFEFIRKCSNFGMTWYATQALQCQNDRNRVPKNENKTQTGFIIFRF